MDRRGPGPLHSSVIRHAPMRLRARLVMRVARAMIRRTYRGSSGIVRWRKARGAVDIRGSLFCEMRDPVDHPFCEYYASAIRRVMRLFAVDVDIATVPRHRRRALCHGGVGAPGRGDPMIRGRIRARRAAFAVCLLVATGQPVSTAQSSSAGPPRYLVVPFENVTGEPRLYWLGEASALAPRPGLVGVLVYSTRGPVARFRAHARCRSAT